MAKLICSPFSLVSAFFFDDSGDADDELDDGDLSFTKSHCSTCSKRHRRVFCSSHTDSSLYSDEEDYNSDISDEYSSSQCSVTLDSEEYSSSGTYSSVNESDTSGKIQSLTACSSSEIHSDSTMYCISELSFLAGDSGCDSRFVQQNWKDIEWQTAVNDFLEKEEQAFFKNVELQANKKISNDTGLNLSKWNA